MEDKTTIETKKLHQLGNSVAMIIPADFRHKHHLNTGDPIDVVKTPNMVILLPQEVDFNARILKKELNLAQKIWDERHKLDQLRWFENLSPEERAKVQKLQEDMTRAEKELDEGKGELQ